MSAAQLPEGVTVYQGAHKFEGEVPEGILPQGAAGVTTVTPAPPAPAPKGK